MDIDQRKITFSSFIIVLMLIYFKGHSMFVLGLGPHRTNICWTIWIMKIALQIRAPGYLLEYIP